MKNYIFDMDGTLYNLDCENFLNSPIYRDLKKNNLRLLMDYGIPEPDCAIRYQEIFKNYDGELSLGFEKEFGLDRYEYFATAWNLDAGDYMKKNPDLLELFSKLQGRISVLTSAPRVWAESVLKHLGIYEYVKDSLFTGEGDLRKPNPEIFRYVVDKMDFIPEETYSIGDQEYSDILPAKEAGLKTIIIGKSEQADFEADSITEVIEIITNQMRSY